MIASSVGRQTLGSEALLLEKAVAEKDVSRAARLTGAAGGRGELAELLDEAFEPPVELVLSWRGALPEWPSRRSVSPSPCQPRYRTS